MSLLCAQGHARPPQPVPGKPHRSVPLLLSTLARDDELTVASSPAELPVDNEGLVPSKLEETLDNFATLYPGKRFPRLLYTMCVRPLAPSPAPTPPISDICTCSPTGSNPTGATAPESRRQAVLALARKHNLLILEDDAYHFLSFDPTHLVPSYFELEARDSGKTGRVVRFDSFSKILSSGASLFLPPTPCRPRADAALLLSRCSQECASAS